MKVILEMHIAH